MTLLTHLVSGALGHQVPIREKAVDEIPPAGDDCSFLPSTDRHWSLRNCWLSKSQ